MQDTASALMHKLQRSINIVHNPVSGWVILAISVLLTFSAFWITSSQVRARAEQHFEFRANEISLRIRQRLMLYEQALQGGRGLFNSSAEVTRQEWQHYVASLHLAERLPGIQGMGFSLAVAPHQLDEVVNRVKAEGFPTFAIHPDGERDFYTTILFLEPFDWRNRRAFGYDMWSHPVRREAMLQARDTGEPATSGVITLVQETNRNVQRGFLIYVPVYRTADIPSTVAERRQALFGWVYSPFRMGDLMNGILGSADANILFKLYDGDNAVEDALLFSSEVDVPALAQPGEALFETAIPIEVLGRRWTAHFVAPQQALMRGQDANQPLYILVAGIVVDLLLFYVIISLHIINRYVRRTSAQMQNEFAANQQNLALQTRLVETMEREAQAFFELAPGAFLVVSQQGVISKANRYAHDMLRFAEGGLVGLRMEVLLADHQSAGLTEALQALFADPSARVVHAARTITLKRHNQQEFPASLSMMPVEIGGAPHVVMAVHDLSQQKQIEQTLEDAREKAESASRAKTEFVANMSHEIRTPLNAVLGAAQLLEKTATDQLQQKYIRMIRTSGEALLGVINDILDFSKIEAGRLELSPIAFNLDEVLARVAVMMSVAAGEKNIELVVRVDAEVPRALLGDALRLQQVLINLISNAVKFTEQGEVVLAVELEASAPSGHAQLNFLVRDTGIGMTLQQQTRLFTAFAQADASITRRFGGTGLGLVISNQIVTLMGGRLRVISEPGIGSEFAFSVAFATTSGGSRPASATPGPAQCVLLIDANRETQLSAAAIIQSWGWQLLCCDSWQAAVTRDAAVRPHIALISYKSLAAQPGDFAQRLAELKLAPGCVKVLLFANQQQALLMMAEVQRHFDAGVAKPILSSNLRNALQETQVHALGLENNGDRVHTAGTLNGTRILLVEDNVFNQTVAQGLLEDMGAVVTIANHGAEAVAVMESDGAAVDVILMDIQMPVMDGITATSLLRKAGFAQPIIAMTAGVLMSEREQYLAAGMTDLVPKPIDSHQLWSAINSALAGSAPAMEAIFHDDPAPVIEDVPIFNAHRIEQLTKGRPQRVQSMMRSIADITVEAQNGLVQVRQEVQDADWSAARKTLHRLKGMVVNFGGERFAQCVKAMEELLEMGPTQVELEESLRAVQQALDEYTRQAGVWSRHQEARLAQIE